MMNRRKAIGSILLTGAGVHLYPEKVSKQSFKYSLNMSTLRGHGLGFRKELEVAAKAGYTSVEIWVDTFQKFLQSGHSLDDAKHIIQDLGLTVENAIGFANWIVDDPAQRQKGMMQLKLEMDQLAAIGCRRIAAPPAGAVEGEVLNLDRVSERYRAILELGDQTGVVPQLELWGFAKNLSRVGPLLYVASEASHPSARLLMDVYHLHKGGSGMDSVRNVGPSLIEIFHINDYPSQPGPADIKDADRLYAGDGVAPLPQLLRDLTHPENPVILSFEVFNKTYYGQDALLVAKTGLAKMKQVVALSESV
ncbi:sugar phosphate isomerase/epimerase [Dyadobacter jejuensis]|uniref:Sugar phosphate isomerase/epimerase n=1 Tax=Dyadobacter jejuensis TaxID=1082580 RepID=A0A316AQH8_9BACT|nr:sugar phosphate isomerase/epimerase family protein [Dyadobacter jejuensis]PWJ59030.1 sugar phosphate isomerase/epimerase [Dyadobacter jejuensis]